MELGNALIQKCGMSYLVALVMGVTHSSFEILSFSYLLLAQVTPAPSDIAL